MPKGNPALSEDDLHWCAFGFSRRAKDDSDTGAAEQKTSKKQNATAMALPAKAPGGIRASKGNQHAPVQ